MTNLFETVTADQYNLFSVKLLYFIDYLNLQKKKKVVENSSFGS